MSDGTTITSLRASRLVPAKLLGDGRLAELAQAGDRGALSTIFERYHQPLYGYCRSLSGSAEDAEDAFQNAMIAAFGALPGEKRTIALKPWLFRIAHNESMSLLRRRRPEVQLEQACEVEGEGPDGPAATRERVDGLMADLRELPERQRGALLMRELTGLKYDEIATAFGTSPTAAKQAAYDARVALQEIAKGREMDCDSARWQVSERDGRVLRGRHLRAHLRACSECRDFSDAIGRRRVDLAVAVPPLSAPSSAALLDKLLGGGGGGGGVSAAAASGVGGPLVLGPMAVKGLALGVAAGIATAGAAGLASPDQRSDRRAPSLAPAAASGDRHRARPASETRRVAHAPSERSTGSDRDSDRPISGDTGGQRLSQGRGEDARAENAPSNSDGSSEGQPAALPSRPASSPTSPGPALGRELAQRRVPGGSLPAPAQERIQSVPASPRPLAGGGEQIPQRPSVPVPSPNGARR